MARSILLRALLTVCSLSIVQASHAEAADELPQLKAQLQQNLARLQTAAMTVSQCTDINNCELRLWISEPFIANTLSHLLSNRSVTAVQTGQVPDFLNGGDALGCGWNVNIGGFNASLALEAVNASWAHNGNAAQLLLTPNFNFGARAQVFGHVNGPPGPCSLFKWGCECPIGGGVGASVGVAASLRDALPLVVSFQETDHQLQLVVRQPSAKKLNVNASIGLGGLGSVGFRIPLELSQLELYRQSVPLAFGAAGALAVNGTTKTYSLDFKLSPPRSENQGLALRSKITVVWTQ
jgi:hypothetical protein